MIISMYKRVVSLDQTTISLTMPTENHRGDFSEKSCNVSNQESDVSKFYNGKSIFITGAAGFLGVVILEALLRCCPGIKKIFILLRPKNGMKADDRKTEIFKREIFNKLKADNPDALNKVTVVPGDITQENLGINESDLARITKEVSIVFHCAATVSFFKPLSFIMNQNVIGTDNIIDFCHKLVKLEVLVYTSTLYSNSNRTTEIDEKIYKMPFKAEYAVTLSRKGDIDGLNSLFSCFHPQFPNFYTFSKCVAENLLNEKAHDLPVCIVRPSVIICCMKGSMPGYIEDNSVMVIVSLGIGKGFIRVGPIYDDNMNVEVISGDVAANTHIVAAYLQATKSLSSPFIYNCTSGGIVTWKVWFSSLMNLVLKYPIPNSYLIPSVVLCRSPMMYKIYSFIYHYLPAFMIDIILWMIGSEFSLVKTYRFYERSLEKAKPFLTGQWKFGCENFNSLPGKLNSTDAEVFCVDMKDFSLEKFTECLRAGCPFYRVNNKPYEEKLRNTLLRYFLTYIIRCFVLGSIVLVLYLTLFKRIFVALEL